jgi:drug/metabolite transporter (DMT)-like permease
MTRTRMAVMTALALLAFAGNSLLCRFALAHTRLDAATFTAVRLAAGAAVLGVLARARRTQPPGRGSWASALALFGYAAGFSFAYEQLDAGTGALLLFGAVQATMIGGGLVRGERLRGPQWLGLLVALGGLVALVRPGLTAPPVIGTVLMVGAGVSWGVYSLRGRGAGDPLRTTAGNFLRATPLALALGVAMHAHATWDGKGVLYALTSGALTSGVGYAIWYAVLPGLPATRAATLQLAVPVLAAFGGTALLGELPHARLIVSSAAILGGIALVLTRRPAH